MIKTWYRGLRHVPWRRRIGYTRWILRIYWAGVLMRWER